MIAGNRLFELRLQLAVVSGRMVDVVVTDLFGLAIVVRIASNQMLLNSGRTRSPDGSSHEIGNRPAPLARSAVTHRRARMAHPYALVLFVLLIPNVLRIIVIT